MLALGIRYLTGYAAATDLAAQTAEWPPHWGRVFMAMAAAHFETGGHPAEREALEWIEVAPAPALRASGADERTSINAYVPVNDKKGGVLANGRQARDFRKTRPRDEFVYFVWEDQAPNDVRDTLDSLCRKVTRIGHSSSAVHMWVVPAGERPEPNWIPSDGDAEMQARVTSGGTLRTLAAAFNGPAIQEYDTLSESLLAAKGKQKGQIKKELQERFLAGRPESKRPHLTSWRGYAHADKQKEIEVPYDGPFEDSFIVLSKEDGPVLGLESTLQLTTALRNAALVAAGERPPEWLSGHKPDGTPSDREHAAFFPLPYVGFEHSDGHVMGLGIAIPRTLCMAPVPNATRNCGSTSARYFLMRTREMNARSGSGIRAEAAPFGSGRWRGRKGSVLPRACNERLGPGRAAAGPA
jgi:CRISPR-associated protein Csb2